MRWRLVFAAAATTGLLYAIPVVASSATSPAALLASILAAGRAQHSVHYVSSARLAATHVLQVADVGATEGIQRITFTKGGRTGQVTVVVSNRRVYFRGDAFVLVNYMGFKPTASASYAHKWVLIPAGDRDYSTVAAAVTLPSAIGGLQIGRPTSTTRATIEGQRVVGVRWRAVVAGNPIVATLYAKASGKPLPVEDRATGGSALLITRFSRWNERFHITVPVSATPIGTTGLE